MQYAAVWMEFESIRLNEIRQKEMDRHRMTFRYIGYRDKK